MNQIFAYELSLFAHKVFYDIFPHEVTQCFRKSKSPRNLSFIFDNIEITDKISLFWNSLPDEIKSIEKINVFKQKLIKYITNENYDYLITY